MTTATAPSEAPLPAEAVPALPTPVPALDVVVPVYNEEAGLESCLRRLHAHLTAEFPYRFRITVADNASTDGTLAVARRVAAELPSVAVVHLDRKGRGRALRAVWSASDAPVLAYLDEDLCPDLAALAPLVAPLLSGHSDLAIGTRLARGSRVVRGPKREVISRCYNLILRGTLAARFSDAQCGFKAIRADVAAGLLPLVEDDGGFFDTELLVLAERSGLRIHEVPVNWVDDPDSRVDIVATALGDLRGVVRVSRALATGRLPVAALRAQFGRASLDPGTPTAPGAHTAPVAGGGPLITYLSASGWVNEFYAAATRAGAQSWTAWFFGALDPGSAITVDKPPAALWLSGLSARIFGMSSWSPSGRRSFAGMATDPVATAASNNPVLSTLVSAVKQAGLVDRGC